jgi:hypothetical protein
MASANEDVDVLATAPLGDGQLLVMGVVLSLRGVSNHERGGGSPRHRKMENSVE